MFATSLIVLSPALAGEVAWGEGEFTLTSFAPLHPCRKRGAAFEKMSGTAPGMKAANPGSSQTPLSATPQLDCDSSGVFPTCKQRTILSGTAITLTFACAKQGL